jgi:PPK2 family polyphosphate:nucleotide phosphotransferase
VLDELRIAPGKAADLAGHDPADRLGLADDDAADAERERLTEELRDWHKRLWAEGERSILVVLQAMDTGGKDGVIKKVFRSLDLQGMRLNSFKAPGGRELEQDYLWRVHQVTPPRGHVGIFNRSHYEDVVAARVRRTVPGEFWERRYRHLREFERMLADEGTTVVKFFLHISKDEQRRRLQARLERPDKNWKFRAGDLEDRKLWDDFMKAYEDAITATSTEWGPWYVVPADHKPVRDVAVAAVTLEVLQAMDPQYPDADPEIFDLDWQ